MSEIIKNLAIYTGLAGVSIYLVFSFYTQLIKKNIFSKLTPSHTFKTIILLSLLGFLIVMVGVFIGFSRKNDAPKVLAIKCPIIKEGLEIRTKALKMKEASKILDSDDILILDVLGENFLKLEKINPACDEIDIIIVGKEIEKIKSILSKYD